MITGGVDSGSRAIKVVLWDSEKSEILGTGHGDQGVDQGPRARRIFEKVCREAGIESGQVARVVATGYGREMLSFADTRITEITCHARGVACLTPEARSVVDIGGQDSKVIHMEPGGRVRDFAMNDRCAAGTGRFLEIVARNLDTPLDHLGQLAAASRTPSSISSMCVVFAETEIIGLLASGAPREDIAAGIQASIASRVAAMAGRNLKGPVIFTGGVARIPGMRESLEQALGQPVSISPKARYTGALGAAILAV